jgi:predicted permease
LLVIAAGLFVRTLIGLKSVDVGFRTNHLLLVEINPDPRQYPPGKDVELHRELAAAFAAIPGVEAVTPSSMVYISNSRSSSDFVPEGVDEHTRNLSEDLNIVGNNFFETLGIPILAGRGFGPEDTASSLPVGVINQSLARKAFPNQNPIGKRFRTSVRDESGSHQKVWITIVGVCADTRYSDLRNAPPPQYILPFVQQPQIGGMSYIIRTQRKPEALVPELQRVAQRIAPEIPLSNIRTQQQQIDATMQQERVFVTLSSGFGLLALALASVGIYGIMAYSVSQRTNEIGVRLAVGAQPWQVRTLILKESTWLTLAGIATGTLGALLLCRLVKSMLYGIQPYDPATVAIGVLILLTVAMAASWIPAGRAAGLDPMEALRHE